VKHRRYDRRVPERRRILLLDSDERRRRVTATMLRLGGYSVLEGGLLADARELVADGVDLLMAEPTLSDGDAVAYAGTLRSNPATRGLPILFATADRTAQPRVAEALDERSFFALPERPSRLLDRIALLLAPAAEVDSP
jgi:CheY-like chemotaxis protein